MVVVVVVDFELLDHFSLLKNQHYLMMNAKNCRLKIKKKSIKSCFCKDSKTRKQENNGQKQTLCGCDGVCIAGCLKKT